MRHIYEKAIRFHNTMLDWQNICLPNINLLCEWDGRFFPTIAYGQFLDIVLQKLILLKRHVYSKERVQHSLPISSYLTSFWTKLTSEIIYKFYHYSPDRPDRLFNFLPSHPLLFQTPNLFCFYTFWQSISLFHGILFQFLFSFLLFRKQINLEWIFELIHSSLPF